MTEIVETNESNLFGPTVTKKEDRVAMYQIALSAKGREFVGAWKEGDQSAAIRAASSPGRLKNPSTVW